MKMIVGLGNPGQKYVGTRHNIGFDIIGEFAKKKVAPYPKAKFEAEYSEIRLGDEKVVLLCPLTFMNLSGRSVSQAANFFKVVPSDILVICDDFNLTVEKIRFRPSGSAGGQNGLADIIKMLGTQDFPRLRVGIGPVPERWNPADFVLGKFSEDETQRLRPVVERCVQGLEDWVKYGVQRCMNLYNGAAEKKKKGNSKSKPVGHAEPDKPSGNEKQSTETPPDGPVTQDSESSSVNE